MDMKCNQINDDELEQVAGGRNLFEIFTAEFREILSNHKNRDSALGAAEENDFNVSTLEMRVNPIKKSEKNESPKYVKL